MVVILLVHDINERGQGRGLAGARRPCEEYQAPFFVAHLHNSLGNAQLVRRRDGRVQEAGRYSVGTALPVDIDTEPGHARNGVGHIELPLFLEVVEVPLFRDDGVQHGVDPVRHHLLVGQVHNVTVDTGCRAGPGADVDVGSPAVAGHLDQVVKGFVHTLLLTPSRACSARREATSFFSSSASRAALMVILFISEMEVTPERT